MSNNKNTERATVRTYIPQYQKDTWAAEAEDLDMSQSEYVRSMVQAGRRNWSLSDEIADGGDGSDDEDPIGDYLREGVLGVLEDSEYVSWDELEAALQAEILDRLDEVLQDLQQEDVVVHSRDRGYTRIDG